MTYTKLATGTQGTGPKIPYTFYYSKRRSGKDMIYKIKVVIGAVTGYSSFGYPIKVSVNCGGKTASKQIKDASPSQWSSSITYETSELTVANKVSGTTTLSIKLTGVDAPRGSSSYTYNLPIDAAMSNVSATNANIGSVSKITISKNNSSFTHTLQYSYNGTSFTNIVTKTSAATYNWTIPTATYNQLGSKDKSKTITIKCITYSGSTEIGSKTTKITAYAVEAACKPTVSITITNNSVNAGLTGSADTIINNNGGVVITGAATTKYSATISKNRISVGSEVYANTSKTFSSLPSGSIQFTATDSRGYSNTATANRTVIQYVKPTISIGKPTITTGGVATFKIKGNWFNGSFGATNNTLTVQYAYGAADEEYSVWQNAVVTKSGNTFSVNITVSNLDYTKRYKFKTRVVDKLNTIYSIEVSAQAIPIFDWGENDFKVNGDFRVTGTTTLDGNLTGKYLTGTWLQTTAATDLNNTPPKVAVLNNSGWIYSRTPNELKSDMGLSKIFIRQSITPKDWNIPANSSRGGEIKGTFKGYEGYTPILTSCYCVSSYYVAIINAWLTGSYSSSSNGYTWHIDARNFASSNITADFSIAILWIKTNLFG